MNAYFCLRYEVKSIPEMKPNTFWGARGEVFKGHAPPYVFVHVSSHEM